MNNELYLNETTKVGVVVEDKTKLKKVESNENEDTVKILELQNEIESENKNVVRMKEILSDAKAHIILKCINLMLGMPIIILAINLFNDFNIIQFLIKTTMVGVTMSIIQILSKNYLGSFKVNRLFIKELPKEIEKSEDKIKSLEEELKNLKEKCNYNENKISKEAMIKLAVINYPERTNEETLSTNFQLPAKIKKITFDHDGTTK